MALKMKQINKKQLVIGSILFVVMFGLLLMMFFHKDKESLIKEQPYVISNKIEDIPGTNIYTNEELSASHCLEGICISDVTFHYIDEEGRVDYVITNNTDKVQSGYLKMKVDEGYLLIAYQKLGAFSSIKTISSFKGFDLSKTIDYTLEKLSDKEIKTVS